MFTWFDLPEHNEVVFYWITYSQLAFYFITSILSLRKRKRIIQKLQKLFLNLWELFLAVFPYRIVNLNKVVKLYSYVVIMQTKMVEKRLYYTLAVINNKWEEKEIGVFDNHLAMDNIVAEIFSIEEKPQWCVVFDSKRGIRITWRFESAVKYEDL